MTAKLTVSIGDPIAELPLTVTQGSSLMWETTAAACRANPGMWIPVTIPGIKDRRGFHNASYLIRTGQLKAFRDGGVWDAVRKGDTIFVQLVEAAPAPDPDAALIDELCKLTDAALTASDYLAQAIAIIRAHDAKTGRR